MLNDNEVEVEVITRQRLFAHKLSFFCRPILLLLLYHPPHLLYVHSRTSLFICMQSALVPAVRARLKWKWEEEKEQITQAHALPPGWPTI